VSLRDRILLRPERDTDLEPEPGALLSVRNVTAKYGAIAALRGVDFHLCPGEIVTLLGANGAGKTTSLNAITGLVPVTEGAVFLDGENITNRPPEWVVNHGVGLSPEGRRVFAKLTVDENLRLGAGMRSRSFHDRRRAEVIDLFPVLDAKRQLQAGLLSGGEQQQLAIARALMSDPKVLLLDEPSLGLAPLIVQTVFELIGRLRESGVSILLVEQNADRALEIADRAYVLTTGRIELSGSAEELRRDSAVEAAYLGIGVA
jgi:branched-chain amino acid transport system ATP-binding protein